MKFMLMGFDQKAEHPLAPEEVARRVRAHQRTVGALVAERAASGSRKVEIASVGLGPEDQTITLLRENDRFVETDGPYAEVKEVLGGFDIIDFDSRDGAIHFAKIKGAAKAVHVEEIRPIREMWWVHAGFGTGEAKVFMISMLDDGRPLPSSELQSAISAHEDTGNGYINQRTARDGKTMAFAGVRLGLASEAATLRIADGKQLLSDGPFAETKEVLGGFQMITCETTAEAIEHAKRLCRRDGDLVEIRPVDATWWIYHA